MDPDPDPGGPKTCGSGGSGSAILPLALFLYISPLSLELFPYSRAVKTKNYVLLLYGYDVNMQVKSSLHSPTNYTLIVLNYLCVHYSL